MTPSEAERLAVLETIVPEVRESLKEIREDVKSLKPFCDRTTDHQSRIESLEEQLDKLDARFWWGVTAGIVALIGVTVWVFELIAKHISGG